MTKVAENFEKKNKVTEISDMLEVFGKYQIVQFFYACLPAMFANIVSINYVFVAGDVEYRCRVPECENSSAYEQHPSWWPSSDIDRCSKPVLHSSFTGVCTNASFTGALEQCTDWIYENNDTIIPALNLACQPWKISLVGTINCFGTMCSMLVAGWMCDRYGRKPTLIICAVGGLIGQLKTFATSYYTYIPIEFIEALLSGGVNAAVSVIMIEIAGIKQRLLSGMLFAYAVYVGEFALAIAAMYVHNWKTLVRIIYTPFIFFITYIFLMKESPRWQILNGRTEAAKESLRLIAKENNINISEQELANLDELKLKEKFNMQSMTKKEGLIQIFSSREIMKRLLVAAVCRFTASFVYYGLMINSVWLPGNKYTNFMLATVMSFPGELGALYVMNKIGRKLPLIVGFIASGILCIASGYVPKEHPWVTISLFLLGKMIIALCFTGAVTYTMELFPTSVRGSLLGLGAFASRVGGMLAPLTPMLMTVSPVLPAIFFGTSALLSGLALTLTPETKDLPLMDTIEQVNALANTSVEKGQDNYTYRGDGKY